MNKNILLISYTFPPYPGIGGRRWAKLVKYLSRNGYNIHVIHAKNGSSEISLWFNDIKDDPNIRRYELDDSYPQALVAQPKSLMEKLKYRLALLKVRFSSKGTPYDKGLFWREQLLALSNELITKYTIQNVIVSCAPFSLAYYALQLKEKYSKLNLIVDFRDPWTWGKGYGFTTLAPKRFGHEKMMQDEVIKQADKILVPVDVMKEHLIMSYPDHSGKINILPHAFDQDEIRVKSRLTNNKVKIVFYGSLYDGIGEYMAAVSKAILNCRNDVVLEIYSDSRRYSDIFSKDGLLGKRVFYYESIPTETLFKKIEEASYVLVIHPDYGIDNVSTKFYEIIYSRTPILYISKPGFTSKFIEKNKTGYFFKLNEIERKFEYTIIGKVPYSYNENFNVEEFSFDAITKQLISNYLK